MYVYVGSPSPINRTGVIAIKFTFSLTVLDPRKYQIKKNKKLVSTAVPVLDCLEQGGLFSDCYFMPPNTHY